MCKQIIKPDRFYHAIFRIFETAERMKTLYKYRFRPAFLIGLLTLFVLSACHVQKNSDSDDGAKTTKDKASKKKKKDPKVMCYYY